MRSQIAFLLLAVSTAAAGEPLQALPSIKMMVPKSPAMMSALPPPERAPISHEVRYYIDSPVKLVVTSSPPGFFEAVEKKGPLTVITKFSDDPSVIAEKEFKGPFVYYLKPLKSGPCEILAIRAENPVKTEDGKAAQAILTVDDIHRQMATVDDGTGPRPPPKPDEPDVEPVTSFRVIFATESGTTLTATQNSILYGKQIEDWLKANTTAENGTAGYRRYDKDRDAANDQPVMAALWAAVRPKVTSVPCIVIERNGKAEILPLPKTVAETLTLLQKYRGAK